MGRRLPLVHITPEDVIGYGKRRGQKPTLKDAENWLSCERKLIEEAMSSIVQENLDRILDAAAARVYPDPVFDRQYRAIEDALTDAAEVYGENISKAPGAVTFVDLEMVELVRRALIAPQHFSACIAYQQEYGEDTQDRVITHRAHVTLNHGAVSAQLLICCCQHGDDVFVPERARRAH